MNTTPTNTADLRAALIEARDWFESQAKAVSKGCGSSYELNDLRVQRDALDAALAAPAQPVTWPRNAAEVREFMEDSCQREEYENDDNSPSVDDLYVLTAHDFLSAVNWWADSHYHPGAPQPAAPVASSADMVMAALDTEEWGLERMQRCDYLTDEGNREGAWLVKRQKAPYCAVYTDKPGEPYGPRSWSGPTALDALQKAADDLGIHLPQPAARGAAQAAPVDASVKRESQYNRGFRHGYNRRDAEVKGALA